MSSWNEAAIECLLFVAGEPVPLPDLSRALGLDENGAEEALRSLQVSLTERGSGLQLLRIAGGWQLSTRAEYAEPVGRLLARSVSKLSRAALETLAIIGYRQPITAPEIEAVRGVSVGGVLKTLLERRLIGEAGRKPTIGRPMLYVTTPDFLHYFGIADISQLPPLEFDPPEMPPVPAEAITDGRVPVQDTREEQKRDEPETEAPSESAAADNGAPGGSVRVAERQPIDGVEAGDIETAV